jgi:hypothetical protein
VDTESPFSHFSDESPGRHATGEGAELTGRWAILETLALTSSSSASDLASLAGSTRDWLLGLVNIDISSQFPFCNHPLSIIHHYLFPLSMKAVAEDVDIMR